MKLGSTTTPSVRLRPRSSTRVGLPPDWKLVEKARAVQLTNGSPSATGNGDVAQTSTSAWLATAGTPNAEQFAARLGLLEMFSTSHGSAMKAKFWLSGENRSDWVGVRTEVA